MDIKRIPSVQPYQVNSASDAADEERRREQQRDRTPKTKDESKTNVASAEVSANLAPETHELGRQIVDSEKMLQLLELRPVRTATQKLNLLRLQSSQRVSAQHKDKKHVNRTL